MILFTEISVLIVKQQKLFKLMEKCHEKVIFCHYFKLKLAKTKSVVYFFKDFLLKNLL